MNQYSWISVFKAISKQVRKYQNNQKKLIDFLLSADINVPMDENSEGVRENMVVLDPFSFIALALVGGDETRKKNFRNLLLEMKIVMEPPEDFCGVPSVQNQNAYLPPVSG